MRVRVKIRKSNPNHPFFKSEERCVEDYIGPYLFDDNKETPERKLLAAFLDRAITDYRREKRWRNDNPQIQRQVEHWIFYSSCREPFSFIWTCQKLGFCPLEVRNRLINGHDPDSQNQKEQEKEAA
jgi:hypothetical protein